MWILEAALTVLLAIPGGTVKSPPPKERPAVTAFSGPDLARTIKADFESISGAGTVTVSSDGATHFNVRIAMPGFNPKICNQIYDREFALYQLFPGLNFDFYFDGPELARALAADLETISGPGTVDVSINSRTLFNVRVAIPGFSSEICSKIFDRELEFYRAFPDLNFDFYLRPMPIEPVSGEKPASDNATL